MKAGIVIGTYGHLPAMRLQLATRAALYPDVPCLVSDDGSDEEAALRELCAGYGVEFRRNDRRMGCSRGDLSAFWNGLKWADEKGLTHLVKLSTRFVFKADWRTDLQREIEVSDMPVIGMRKMHTACLALDVRFWIDGGWADRVRELSEKPFDYHSPHRENAAPEVALYVEGEMRALSMEMLASLGPEDADKKAKYMEKNTVSKPREGGVPFASDCWYRRWMFLGNPETQPSPTALWHKTNTPADYADYARKLGVDLGGEVIRLHRCFLRGRK